MILVQTKELSYLKDFFRHLQTEYSDILTPLSCIVSEKKLVHIRKWVKCINQYKIYLKTKIEMILRWHFLIKYISKLLLTRVICFSNFPHSGMAGKLYGKKGTRGKWEKLIIKNCYFIF